MKKNQATYSGTSGRIRNSGVIGAKSFSSGLVTLTKNFMKKKLLFSGRKMFMPQRPISVHMISPRI